MQVQFQENYFEIDYYFILFFNAFNILSVWRKGIHDSALESGSHTAAPSDLVFPNYANYRLFFLAYEQFICLVSSSFLTP